MRARQHLPQQGNPRTMERRSQVRGLLLLAVLVMAYAVLRAGVGRAFNPGWWRLW